MKSSEGYFLPGELLEEISSRGGHTNIHIKELEGAVFRLKISKATGPVKHQRRNRDRSSTLYSHNFKYYEWIVGAAEFSKRMESGKGGVDIERYE